MTDDKRTLVDGGNPWADYGDDKKTVPAGDQSTPVGSPVYGGSEGKTLVDDNPWRPPNPFEPTYPPRQPTPPGGTPAPAYGFPPPPPPPPPTPAHGVPAPGGAKTVIMDSQTPPADVPLAWLAVVEGPGGKRGQVFPLGRDVILGRDPGDIVLADRAASGRHLRVRLEASEKNPQQQVFVIYDQGSTNGTYVGPYATCQAAKESGDPSVRAYRHILKDGDFLLIGQTILVFKQVELS